jgi:hypothetical protein
MEPDIQHGSPHRHGDVHSDLNFDWRLDDCTHDYWFPPSCLARARYWIHSQDCNSAVVKWRKRCVRDIDRSNQPAVLHLDNLRRLGQKIKVFFSHCFHACGDPFGLSFSEALNNAAAQVCPYKQISLSSCGFLYVSCCWYHTTEKAVQRAKSSSY